MIKNMRHHKSWYVLSHSMNIIKSVASLSLGNSR